MASSSDKKKKKPAAGDSNVSVYCRVRPLLEQGSEACVTVGEDGKTMRVMHGGEEQVFSFDQSFTTTASQQNIFDGVQCEASVRDVLAGYNATVFAYGQTASGKTHTMEGESIDGESAGIIPRAAAALFKGVLAADSDIEFTIKVSFVEIYMERIRDLLDTFGTKNSNLRIREGDAGIYVSGCTEAFVTNEQELLRKLAEGARARSTAATGMNEGSSRSHSVLMVLVTQRNTKSQALRVGKLVLVDLAGSEMVRKTHAQGQQLEEAKTINKSLSALGHVINALTDGSPHVPYRDSKLTRMLQDSLGGNAKTALIVNVSAAASNASETISTLRFGQRAKAVHNKPKVNETKSVDELTALLHKAEAAIDMQASYISALEAQMGISGDAAVGAAPPSMDVLALQRRVAELTDQLDEERSESKRGADEVASLTTLLHDKDRLLADADDVMREAQERLVSVVGEKDAALASAAAARDELREEADQRSRADFEKAELALRLEKIGAVDAGLRREAATDAATMKVAGASARGEAGVFDDDFLAPDPDQPPPAPAGAAAERSNAAAAAAQRQLAEMRHQRDKLVADVSETHDERERLEAALDAATRDVEAVAASRERQHTRSLQRRLEQLVAVHRQLLRKYAALELTLSEATKKIALRDERIRTLEINSKLHSQRCAAQLGRLEVTLKEVQLGQSKQLPKRAATAAEPPDAVRTIRGGAGARAAAPAKDDSPTPGSSDRRASWWRRSSDASG
ncbi:P-loop containing nucleoside triphosphate hydrolase protein [Pelagophyceae sp. CCMP2097]|nr:P-loop containing nucleoside triphosphate hydrolase protein [Pelagophyceae sp. CCMP2097]